MFHTLGVQRDPREECGRGSWLTPRSAGRQSPSRGRSKSEVSAAPVRGARADFEKARESRYHQTYVRPFKRNLVDVFVSREMLDRALKVANRLFLTLEEHGFRVMLAPSGGRFRHISPEVCEGQKGHQGMFDGPGTWSPAKPTVALVGETAFGITVFEVSEHVDVRYDSATSKYVRVVASKADERRTRRAFHDWTTKHWLPSGRALAYADRIDPLTAWRKNVELVKAEQDGKPCPNCGEVHDVGEPTESTSGETRE